MPTSKICLLDINVWIAIWWSGHIHHDRAKAWFATVEKSGAAFCRITQMGFLRLITNPRIMKDDVVTQKQAWRIYDRIARDSRVIFLSEPEGLENVWKRLTQLNQPGTTGWTDAYLVALSTLQGCTLVTFDRWFGKRDGLDCIVLNPNQ